MTGLDIGDIFRLRTIRHYPRPEESGNVFWVEIAHPDRKLVAVMALLGFERKDGTGPKVDLEAVMHELGWQKERDMNFEEELSDLVVQAIARGVSRADIIAALDLKADSLREEDEEAGEEDEDDANEGT